MKNKDKKYDLYYDNKLIYGKIGYINVREFCKKNDLNMDNLMRTLPNYPNEKRRNGSYRKYKLVEHNYNKSLKTENKEITVINNFDKKEIDFEKGKIRAEKIINLDVDNINERTIMEEFNLDIKKWTIEKLNYSLWDGMKKGGGTLPLYSVKCQFKKRDKLDYDIETMKNLIDDVIGKKVNPKEIDLNKNRHPIDRLLLINIADLHLNKYSDDYNIKIAKNRYISALSYFVGESNSEDVLLVIGEDFFNIDTINKTTTKGTPQDTEVDIYKMFEIGLEFMIEVIEYLLILFKKVNVTLIQGNHDKLLSYMLVKALEQKKYTKDNVYFDSENKTRKYIEYGNSLIGLGHLDIETKGQKPFLMQNEVKEKYGKSKYNYFISGHLHNYSVEEIGGIQYIRLPSLSGSDNWHKEMGYITSNKGAIALEFSKEKGLSKKIIYNV